jgi:hypothetical protein
VLRKGVDGGGGRSASVRSSFAFSWSFGHV